MSGERKPLSLVCPICGGKGSIPFPPPCRGSKVCGLCDGKGKIVTFNPSGPPPSVSRSLADKLAEIMPDKRPPGRPVSTGSAATKLVRYRVTAAQRAELDAEAARLGLSSADLVAKRRAFP